MSNTVITIPKDVWQLIIDKMEPKKPDEYMMPKYIIISNVIIPFDSIIRIKGPVLTHTQEEYLSITTQTETSHIYQHDASNLYDKLIHFKEFYNLDK